MSPADWRKKGYKTIFRGGYIFLASPTGKTVYTNVNYGEWMNYEDVTGVPWHSLSHDPEVNRRFYWDIQRAIMACYCHQLDSICDFCAGIRSPE